MNSRTTDRFRQSFANLPRRIQDQARNAYRLFQQNPSHPGLRFKKVHPIAPVYSARIGDNYRAVGLVRDDAIVWFWIGSHAEYERLLASL